MRQKPIYTEPENCQDCYKCIRECPVKAIRIESNKAYIIDERCIYCGHCTLVCPTGAKNPKRYSLCQKDFTGKSKSYPFFSSFVCK
ncbi:MAG: 4Fe-4S binding protein [Odoribacter sp.]|nr:4Fe-4S binding protein [Odoribacter sp.]